MPCHDYDLLDGANLAAIEALQLALRSRANTYVKSRARSRLMIADAGINSHLTTCKQCG